MERKKGISNEKRFRTFRDLYTAIDDAKTLGLSEREIETQLKKAKVANYKDVMRNRFRPIELNTDILRASPAPQDIRTPINIIERYPVPVLATVPSMLTKP